MTLSLNNVSYHIEKRALLHSLSLEIKTGEFLGIIGRNGSGKSSLLSLISGINKPSEGSVMLQGKNLEKISKKIIAQHMAFLEQNSHTLDRITVKEIIKLSQIPHVKGPFYPPKKNEDIIEKTIQDMNLHHLTDKIWQNLSGGEQQRVQIGRVIAQNTPYLILDEPTNHLDIHHQFEILSHLRSMSNTKICSLHDLTHAAYFCDRIVIMDQGHTKHMGKPEDILTPEILKDIFHINGHLKKNNFGTYCLHCHPVKIIK